MASVALETPTRSGGFVAELFKRQPLLAGYAIGCLALGLLALAGSAIDPRTIGPVSVWLKPAKFFFSIALFSGTMAWFFEYVRPERRSSALMLGTIAVLFITSTFELAWISWQGAHGRASHFNTDTPFYGLMYSLMGVGAVLLVSTTLAMAWEIVRRPVAGIDPAYRLGVVLGLVLTFALGGSLGGYISANGGAPVGDYSSLIPLFAWNQEGGDLRVAHFFGIHAQQALPLFAALLLALQAQQRRLWVLVGAAAYAAITLGVWAQAVAGRPFIG